MRIWHKDLIPVLPRQQLLSQWRECCCIARNIKVNGTPNHILVNKVLDYPVEHFVTYANIVYQELLNRDYKVNQKCFLKHLLIRPVGADLCSLVEHNYLFEGWHNDRYLKQCFYNLQEKYDCGGITDDEWNKIKIMFDKQTEIC